MSKGTVSEAVRAYLWHGYLPPEDMPAWMWDVCSVPSGPFDYSVAGAVARLDALIDRLTVTVPSPYIVPLSGGWDSRLILAALREKTDKIVTVTLGCPGQLDYELGARVAEAAQVEHLVVPLDQLSLEWSALRESAQSASWTYMPDAFFLSTAYQQAARNAGEGAKVWSGFLGEALTGGHYRQKSENETPSKAREAFARSQRRVDTTFLPLPTGLPCYLPPPPEWAAAFGQREWLDFSVRQRGCIAPIVLGKTWQGWRADQGTGWGGLQMVAPYADREWATYWLNAPRCLHERQTLYRQMAETRFPELFGLPSKSTWGVSKHQRGLQLFLRAQHGLRNRMCRHLPSEAIRSRLADNYIDFQWAFRTRDDYISVAEQAIALLKRHEVISWLDLDRIWQQHYRGRHDHAQALQVLLGLAVNLEANG